MRPSHVVAGCLSLVIAVAPHVPAAQDADSPPTIAFAPFTFTSDFGEPIAAEKGWLTVPERRGPRRRGAIDLPVVRFRATSRHPAAPLIFLAGGPGDSGIDTASHAIFPLLMALRDRGDVVVFDQRGTGEARPSLRIPGPLQLDLGESIDSPANRARMIEQARQAARELGNRGIDLSAYNTSESADDVDDVRRALGAGQIVIWGHSYGSHLGLEVIRRHGPHVERAILGGVNGLDQRWRSPADLDALVDRVSAEAASLPKLAAQVPNLRDTVASVLSTLKTSPVSATFNGRRVAVSARDVQVLVALSAGDSEFVHALPILFGRLRAGDYSRVAQRVAAMKTIEAGTAMRFAMHIASGVSDERRSLIERLRPTALFGDAVNFPFDMPEFVAAWSVADLGEAFRTPVASAVPALFISGTLDGRTSLSDADAVRATFTRGARLVVDGVAHDLYHRTPAVLEAMRAFLDGRDTPQEVKSPMVYRGPDEPDLIAELMSLVAEKGAPAAVARMRAMAAPTAREYLTSYVPGTMGVMLSERKRPKEAVATLEAGLELFPNEPFLTERLADLYRLQGDREKARRLYQACVAINPLNRSAAWKSR